MSKLYRRFSTISMLGVLALLFITSCERRPLEVLLDDRVRVRIVADWDVNYVALYGNRPNGMTVMLWGENSTAPIIRTTNANSLTVMLPQDTYRLIIFNELMEEYAPYVNFYEANSYDRMVVRSSSYVAPSRAWDTGLEYMYTPEDPRITVALDTFTITPSMVLRDTTIFVPYEEYRDHGYSAYGDRDRYYEIPELPWPMTVDLYVRVKIKHRQSLKAIEGNITGLADGFYPAHIIRTSESGTLRFDPDNWDKTKFGAETDSMGIITTRLASFGLPYGKELIAERDSADNMLNFSLTLINDSVVNYSYKVGKDIRYITPEGVEARIRYRQDLRNLQLEIELPEIINLPPVFPKGGAGFDAWVDEWDDGGTFEIGGFARKKQ